MNNQTQVAAPRSTAVAVKKDIRDVIQAQKDEIAKALPRHMNPDRMIRVMLTAINTTPKLMSCTKESLLGALMKCSQYGLEPDGRHAHLIPYGDDCQLIFDYKGLVNLVRRSGDVTDIHCDVVYEKDHFEFGFGTGGGLVHKPNLKEENRGEITCAYSFVKLKDGSVSYEVMPWYEINKIMENSQGFKAGKKYNKPSVWETHWAEMAKKTVFRRHSKWLPLSFEVSEAIHADDDTISAEEKRFAQAKAVTASTGLLEAPSPLPLAAPEEAAAASDPQPTKEPAQSVQGELSNLADENGCTLLEFSQWAKSEGHIAVIPSTWDQFPEDSAKRLLKAKREAISAKLQAFKAEVSQ